MKAHTSYVTEPQKRVPVVRDVDVVVAGAGCSGVFAALAAAAGGARTILVERTGMLGGNAGPGMLFGCTDPMSEGPAHLPGGNTGIVRIVERRMNEAAGGRA
jgi:flavin-dependent dehydrogenase